MEALWGPGGTGRRSPLTEAGVWDGGLPRRGPRQERCEAWAEGGAQGHWAAYTCLGTGTPKVRSLQGGLEWEGPRHAPCPPRFRGIPLGAAARTLCFPARAPGRRRAKQGGADPGRVLAPILRPRASRVLAPRPSSSGVRVRESGSPLRRRGRCRRGRAGPERRSAGARGAELAQGPPARAAEDWGPGGLPCAVRGAAEAGARPVSARAGRRRRRRRRRRREELGAAPRAALPALRSSMALPGPPEPPRGAPRKAPSLLEMGALCLDSEIILGFTSHLLRRRAKVRAGRRDPAGGRGAVPRLCGAAPAARGAAPGKRRQVPSSVAQAGPHFSPLVLPHLSLSLPPLSAES